MVRARSLRYFKLRVIVHCTHTREVKGTRKDKRHTNNKNYILFFAILYHTCSNVVGTRGIRIMITYIVVCAFTCVNTYLCNVQLKMFHAKYWKNHRLL